MECMSLGTLRATGKALWRWQERYHSLTCGAGHGVVGFMKASDTCKIRVCHMCFNVYRGLYLDFPFSWMSFLNLLLLAIIIYCIDQYLCLHGFLEFCEWLLEHKHEIPQR